MDDAVNRFFYRGLVMWKKLDARSCRRLITITPIEAWKMTVQGFNTIALNHSEQAAVILVGTVDP